nr:multiple epidermal growth factor-like domains protein 6 [Crassostrea gigas]
MERSIAFGVKMPLRVITKHAFILLLFFTMMSIVRRNEGINCNRDGNCCTGYILNAKTQECDVCPPGEHGTNCSSRCPYPLYGLLCLEYCKCSRDLCDYVSGCSGSTTANPKCSPGFLGKNCRGKCAYPYYGEECQGQCDCDIDSCDVSTGCRNISREASTLDLSGNLEEQVHHFNDS